MTENVTKMSELPEILTVCELAKVLRLGINTTYKIVRQKKIKSIRMGRQYRIPRWAVVEYLNQGKNECA